MKKFKILAIGSVLLICGSCNEKQPPVELPNPNGIWQQLGYGKIIELNDSILKVYDITGQTCNLSFEEEILDFGRIKSVRNDTLTIEHGIDEWLFTKVEKLPDLCATSGTLNSHPGYNFQTFWETFKPEFDYSSGFRPPINSGFQLKIVKK